MELTLLFVPLEVREPPEEGGPVGADPTTVAMVVGVPAEARDEPVLPDVSSVSVSPGVILAGTDLARAAKVSMVRDWSAAGLLARLDPFGDSVVVMAGALEDVDWRDLRVDHPHHTRLTVLGLRAIEPNGARVVDHNGICRHLGALGYRHEAGEETGDVGLDVIDGLAWLVEGRLHHRVVLQSINY